jgi:hypothetical protein
MNQDYLRDLVALRFSRLADGAMRFRRRGQTQAAAP